MDIARQAVAQKLESRTKKKPSVTALIDSAASGILFGNPQGWSYEALEAIRDEVIDDSYPNCTQLIAEAMTKLKVF